MDAMQNVAPGTRLRCSSCATEIVVVKPATGPLGCCGQPMVDVSAAATADPDTSADAGTSDDA
jgi:hypothetical protein